MLNPLCLRLAAGDGLNRDDREALEALCRRPRQVAPHTDLISEGEQPNSVYLLLEGFACRYKLVQEGDRQIIALLVPGDLCDASEAVLGPIDHSIGTLTHCRVAEIPPATVRELTIRSPRIRQALHLASLVELRVLRTWLTNLGQRPAEKRLAHLFCELMARLQQVGLADDSSYDMPFKLTDLGDVLGVTSIHVSRSLRELRGAGLIVLGKRRLTIPDVERLKAYCGFNPSYLHPAPRLDRAA